MTSISDIGLNITYEDGLRLSELMGHRAEAQYMLDHLLSSSMGLMLLAVMMAILLTIPLAMILDSVFGNAVPQTQCFPEGTEGYSGDIKRHFMYEAVSDRYVADRDRWMDDPATGRRIYAQKRVVEYDVRYNMCILSTILVGAALLAVGVALVLVYNDYAFARDIVYYDAQIQAILDKY